jgi:outer membrane protein OmpA-like peptidoglycan-associated protein
VAGLSALTGKDLEVRFAIGSSELGAEARALLLEVVRAMAQAPGDRLLVTGRADASGDAAANLVLSERRAKAVRDFLISHGIGGERVLLNYYGSTRSTTVGVGERRVDLEWLR